jgi:hypothetical protein
MFTYLLLLRWVLLRTAILLLVVVSISIGALHHIHSPAGHRLEEDTGGEGIAEVALRRSIVG